MNEPIEFDGVWWLPHNPDNKISGKFTFIPGNFPSLILNDVFSENDEEERYHDFILGYSSDGKQITLSKCSRRHLIQSIPGYSTSEYASGISYIGHHYEREEDMTFTRILLRVSQAEEWLGDGIFHFDTVERDDGINEHLLRTIIPNSREINLHDFNICIHYDFSYRSDRTEPNIRSRAWFSIEPIEGIHITRFHPIIQHLCNFIHLGVGEPISLLSLEGRNYNIDPNHKVIILYNKFDIESKDNFVINPLMTFTYRSISDSPEVYFQNWLNFIENNAPTHDLFFGTFDNPFLHPIQEFLNYAQAIESYHSRIYDNDVIPEDIFRAILNIITDKINDYFEENQNKYRNHLNSKTRYWNRKTLRNRIKEILEDENEILAQIVDDQDLFIRQVVNSRNFYTHYDPDLEGRAVPLNDLPLLSQSLKLFLLALILSQIGFNNDFIQAAIQRYSQFHRIERIIR